MTQPTLKRTFAILMASLLVSCGSQKPSTTDEVADIPLRLYVFDCGRITFEDVTAFSVANDETEVRELAVPCYIVEHAKGRLLWEGGLPSKVAETDGWVGEGNMRQSLERTFAEQLTALGLDMASFDFAAFSHTHFDHIGVANEVEGATLLIQRAEYDAAFGSEEDARAMYFDPDLYSNLRNAEIQVLDGDHDLFGDGSVRLLASPGHTPGHQSLFLDLAKTGPIVLSGDLYHFRLSREQKRVPTFNFDTEQTLASMNRIEALVEQAGAQLWIEHELASFDSLLKAPSYYN